MLTKLPNLLTLSRIAVIPLMVGTFYLPDIYSQWLACGLFAAAGLTDYLDGHFARRWKQHSEIGRFLDPIADKMLVSGLREYLAGLRVRVPVSRLAKWKTGIQMTAIGFLLVGDAGPDILPVQDIGEALLWVAALLTLVTGYDYLRAGLPHMTDERP